MALITSDCRCQAFELFRQTLRPEHDDADEIARKAAKMRSDAGLALLSNLKFDQALQVKRQRHLSERRAFRL